MNGARGIAFNKKESVLFVVSNQGNSLVKLKRDVDTGQLRFHSSVKNGIDNIVGLRGASTVFVDDNENIFVASFGDNALTVFKDTRDGIVQKSIAQNSDLRIKYFRQPYKVTGDKNSNRVFVTSYKDSSVSEFVYVKEELTMDGISENISNANVDIGVDIGTASSTDEETDKLVLGQVSLFREDIGGVQGIDGAWGVAVHPNGDVLVSGFKSNAVAVFRPEQTIEKQEMGRMEYSHTIYDGDGKIQGLNRAFEVEMSHDNSNIYVSGIFDSSIGIFSKNTE